MKTRAEYRGDVEKPIGPKSETAIGFYGPELNDGKHVFVFGSNLAGRHGKGAALEARKHWGAEYGVGVGPTGQAYAIPTKNLNMSPHARECIRIYVNDFIEHARAIPDKTFLVTKIGCGLAGYSEKDIAPMFKNAPRNCVLPDGWRNLR
jgi:hypothetical protein